MANVTGGCPANLSFTQIGQLGTDSGGSIPEILNFRSNYQNGTAANQINKLYAATLTLAASTPQTVDLTTLTDIAGAAISFTRIVALAYRVQSTNNAHTVTLGGAGSNEWNGWLTNGSKVLAYPSTSTNDGFAVVAAPNTSGMAVSGTSKLLKIDPGSNAVGAFDLVLVGS